MEVNKEEWLAVVNPFAGSGVTMSKWAEALGEIRRLGLNVTERRTGGDYGHASQIAYEASAGGCRNFMAAGGDGTVHDVLTGIMKFVDGTSLARLSDFRLAVVPIGSGNDWIKSHGVEKNPTHSLRLIAADSFKRQDAARITCPGKENSYMINIGGIGLDARVCELVNYQKSKGRRSRFIYLYALFSRVLRHHATPMAVRVDGQILYEGKVFTMAFAVGGVYCGGGMRQCPDALLDDGLIDVTVVPLKNLWRILPFLWKIYTSGFSKVGGVITGRGKKVEVSALGPQGDIMEADGEIVAELPLSVEVVGDQLEAASNIR